MATQPDVYNNQAAMTALAQLLRQGQRIDPFAEQRKFASDLIARGTNTPVGSEGEGWARLGSTALGGITSLSNAYFKREYDKGSRAEMADIMGEKDENKRIEKLKNAQYIDPETMAPIFANILSGQTERDQRTGAAKTGSYVFGGGGGPPPPGVVPAAPPAAPAPTDIYGGTQPPAPAPAPAPPAPPPPAVPTAAAPPQGDNVQTADMATTAGLESSNRPTITNPTSGAAGLYQIMPQTAADLRTRHPDLGLPNDNAATWSVPQQNAAKVRYDQDSARVLAQNGIPVTPATLYLAHRAGATGASMMMRQNPDTPMSAVVPASWIAQNPDMQGKTVGQFAQMAMARFPDVADIPGNTAGTPPADSPAPGSSRPPVIVPPMAGLPPNAEELMAQGDSSVQLAQAPPASAAYDPGNPFDEAAKRADAVGRPELAADLRKQAFEARQTYRLHVEKENATRAAAAASEARKAAQDKEEWDRRHGITSKATEEDTRNKRVDAFSGDFRKDPDVIKYQVARPVMKSAIEAANTNSLAGDLNLVYAFATMMDPGSVVREGEQGMVRATASAGTQVRGLLERLQGNSSLDADTKAKLLDQMHSRYTSYRDEYDRVSKYWEGRAKRAGVDPEDIYMRSDPVPYTRGQPIIYGGANSGSPLPPNAAPPLVTTPEFKPPPTQAPQVLVPQGGKLVPGGPR